MKGKNKYNLICVLCSRFYFLLLAMSIILSASVVRVRDGLPLSASTDYEQNTAVQECRKYFKGLAKRLTELPDRCTLQAGKYNIKYVFFGMSILSGTLLFIVSYNLDTVVALITVKKASFCYSDI